MAARAKREGRSRGGAGGEVASVGHYSLVAAVLVALTTLTVGLAYVPLGALSEPVALGIAAATAAVVALFFMHLRESGAKAARLVAVGALVWLALLLALTLVDVLTRHAAQLPTGVPGG